MNFKSTLTVAIAASVSLLAVATGAYAQTPILDGDRFITELTTPYGGSGGTESTSGFIYSAVFSNTAGGLDFFYQFTVGSASAPVTSFAVSDFTGFATSSSLSQFDNLDIDTPSVTGNATDGPFTTGGVANTFATISSGTASFFYGTNPVPSGGKSNIMYIRTTATNFGTNNASIQAAASANALVLAPATAATVVPESSSLMLIIPGALGIVGMVRRRKSNK